METRLKEKEEKIRSGIPEINRIKESLFQLKKFFYGDFKFSEALGKVPNPNRLIQDAIICLETAIRESMEIEVNSV